MKILGIETSCDETAAAVVEDGKWLISNVVATQIDIHKKYGGVVPEVAARSHIEVINPVIDEALEKAECSWDDIDAIAVTNGPGLSGSLLIGTLAARTLALIKNKPLYPVNHVTGHVYANFLLEPQPEFPMLALIVSGGHTQLALFKSHLEYVLLGQTQDDAVGEAYDKVAKIIGLPYPGGPSIEKAAPHGDGQAYQFPKAKMPKRDITIPMSWMVDSSEKLSGDEYVIRSGYDFSFSGLKTAVLRRVQAETGQPHDFPSFKLAELLTDEQRNNFAASFNRLAVETLVDKAMMAYEEFNPKSVVIAGGVAASKELRKQLEERLPIEIRYIDISLCTDNAAMIATLGYYQSKEVEPTHPHVVTINPNMKM